MRKTVSAMLACVVLATSAVAGSAPAFAQRGGRDRDAFMENYYSHHKHDREYSNWRRGGWNDHDYNRWYHGRRHERGFDTGAAALFGLAAGAIVGGALSNSQRGAYVGDVYVDDHQSRCLARYKTYDPASDTYIANSRGERRLCRL